MKPTTFLGILGILILSSCTSTEGERVFEYGVTDSLVQYNQTSAIVLDYAGQQVKTQVQLKSVQEWQESDDAIDILISPSRIKMSQQVPILGEMTFDSNQETPDEEMSEQELALQEEVMKAINNEKRVLLGSRGKLQQQEAEQDIEDFSANPFLFLEFPNQSEIKAGWNAIIPLENNIPSIANIQFSLLSEEEQISVFAFEGVLKKNKDNEKGQILGIVDLDGKISGEVSFHHEKKRIVSGFSKTTGVCDIIQMNKPLQLEFQIDQQFSETK